MKSLLITILLGTLTMATTTYTPPWLTLPATPTLPRPLHSAHADINNISLWYSLHGRPLTPRTTPVVLLHGGKISSRWYGHLIRALSPSHSILAIDTRGHGRSSDDLTVPLSYDLFASDTVALLSKLRIKKATFIGWSDGANTALSIAMNYPSVADKIVPYGANFRPDQINGTNLGTIPFIPELGVRMQEEYEELNPGADFAAFKARVDAMQAVEPNWGAEDFGRIPTPDRDRDAPIVIVAAGDHEEAIVRSTFTELHDLIPYSQLVIFPGMSHFGPLQDPETFATIIKALLEKSQ
ncbi:Alpha/Beta hydrolase protein [Aspergillus karnatakaensis]|uniref:alpha/beta fold hydrolase n=1 Tax=Aspergillus karnatakaensis TaxID=1810916 RepID=UPI003CCDADC1